MKIIQKFEKENYIVSFIISDGKIAIKKGNAVNIFQSLNEAYNYYFKVKLV
ncbi:MAG: hypothetical protein ACK518_00775 [bacterium]